MFVFQMTGLSECVLRYCAILDSQSVS